MGKKLYVGNLSFSVTEDLLIEKFSQCGTVASAKLVTDRDTGRSKGFAFVEMSTDNEGQKAIEMYDGQEHDGRAMKVSEAKPQESRQRVGFSGSRSGGTGGGFGGKRNRY